MKAFSKTLLALSVSASAMTSSMADTQIETVVVTSDFRQADLMTVGSSVTVIAPNDFSRRDARHLEDVLTLAPNVNFAAGSSRGRFVQIRGIGERSQFKDPLDPSVGLIIDGADLSGVGLAGSVMDVQQVEVLRGPQGTRFGASALAGAINIQSNKPTETFEGEVSAGVGNYDKLDAGLVLSGPLVSESLLARLAYQSNSTDGYIDNDFLNKDDTNNIDEQLARVSLRWLANDDLTIDLNTFYVDADNGYNAFALDNSRDIPTDDPGHDRQETTSISANIYWNGFSAFDVQASLFNEDTDLEYGFDWDWENEALSAWGYRGSENSKRDREAQGADLRLVSNDDGQFLGASWVAGLYWYEREVELEHTAGDNFGYAVALNSQTDTDRLAAYGEMEWALTDQLSLITGARVEQYELSYKDNVGVVADPDDDLWGGKIALEYQLSDSNMVYASVSRGYKGGGVNGQAIGRVLSDPSTDPDVASFLLARSEFDSESLLNYEVGMKGWYLENTLFVSASAFYMDREDMQAKSSVLFPPSEWRDYLDNVDGGENYGLELEANWQVAEQLNLFAAVGLLDTELGDLEVQDLDSDGLLYQKGREQAHAPEYQFNIGGEFNFLNNFYLTIEVDGKDEFYFSNSHDEKSDSYELLHSSVSYRSDELTVTVWGRNLTDEDYQTRGFYFANTPSDYPSNHAYYQLGEPKVYGVSASYKF